MRMGGETESTLARAPRFLANRELGRHEQHEIEEKRAGIFVFHLVKTPELISVPFMVWN